MSHANPARRTRPRRRAPPTSPIRLIAIDVDGTLLDGRGRLPARNRLAVHRAIDAGVRVVLVTGRAFHHARPVAEALAPERAPDALALIVSNGALTKRLDGATLDRRLLPRETARALVAAMRPRGQGVAVIFDRPDARQYVYEGIDWSHPQRAWYYERNRAFMTRVEPIETALDDDPVQVAFTGGVAGMRAAGRRGAAAPRGRRRHADADRVRPRATSRSSTSSPAAAPREPRWPPGAAASASNRTRSWPSATT